jgi:NAD(P)-dependent dehydrogenase (short-subunit alcohol dehydrogenase family)
LNRIQVFSFPASRAVKVSRALSMAEDRFIDKVLFATGGGSGIAAATARRFAAEGGRAAIVDLDLDRARGVADGLDGSCAIACDVSDERSVESAMDEAVRHLGRIDCVLNAAGHVHFAPVEHVSVEEWNRMLAVHLTGTFLVCRAAVPVLRAAGGGSIVNLSSVTALVARANLAAYSAVKGGIVSLSRQLALDLAADNVRVNAIAPGSVRTPMTQPVYGEEGGSPGHSAVPGSIQNRIAEPEEIAATACFLFSDDASFLTGTLLVADGGSTAI